MEELVPIHKIYADNDGVLILNADQGNGAANSYLGFNVDNSERLRITSAGLVGIGTDNPNSAAGLDILNGEICARGIRLMHINQYLEFG